MHTESCLLTGTEASEPLSIAVRTLYQWAKQGKSPHVRLGDRVLFNPADIIAAGSVPAVDFAIRKIAVRG